MQAFELSEVLKEHAAAGKLYLEFLRVPDLSLGIYVLPAGAIDPQTPHTEDEIYYVVSGWGRIEVAGEDRAIEAGSIIYVPKNTPHNFHSIEKELRLLVFFAPAEYSLKESR
jgi:quercetin dioxygenase-like cupin family protein